MLLLTDRERRKLWSSGCVEEIYSFREAAIIRCLSLIAKRRITNVCRLSIVRRLWMGHLSSLSKMEYLCVILLLLYSTILPAAVTDPDVPVAGVIGEDLVLPCSIKPLNAENMEVIWSGERDVVHHYKNHMDKLEEQHPDYRGRTSLFGPLKLQEGNASLKISSFRVSDAQDYTCQINSQTGPITTQYVSVEAVGSIPVITKESLRNGSVNLQCESTGWSTEPQVEWRNSRDQRLSANPTIFQKSEGRVISRVRVERSNGTSFTCGVWTQRFSKQMHTEVDEDMFKERTTGAIFAVAIAIGIIAGFIILILMGRLWLSKEPKHLVPSADCCSIELKWQMQKYLSFCQFNICELNSDHTFKITYQKEAGPWTSAASSCKKVNATNHYTHYSAKITGLEPATTYKVKP